jgi:hypothetical protein
MKSFTFELRSRIGIIEIWEMYHTPDKKMWFRRKDGTGSRHCPEILKGCNDHTLVEKDPKKLEMLLNILVAEEL